MENGVKFFSQEKKKSVGTKVSHHWLSVAEAKEYGQKMASGGPG
jgi:hypothetical protein